MNFYSLFYWFTVADKVHNFFNVFSDIFTVFAILAIIIFTLVAGINKISDEDHDKVAQFWINNFRRLSIWFTLLAVLTWAGYVFTPTKREMVLIVAGGAVGEFVTTDSTARQLPSDVVQFLHTEIKTATEQAKIELMQTSIDTLKDKSKEELIELLKQKQ